MITIESIREKVLKGKKITFEEGLFLYETKDLLSVGEMADFVNKKKNGDKVYFNVNRHINPTKRNIIKLRRIWIIGRESQRSTYSLFDNFGRINRLGFHNNLHRKEIFPSATQTTRQIDSGNKS